jgi:cellulose biosynthesis protein BcsQ
VPGNLELMEFEHDTPRVLSQGDRNDYGRIFFAAAGRGTVFRRPDDYDVVVIDCPPQLGFLTMSAICGATAVLITVHPQMLDVMSMCQFLQMLGEVLNTLKKRWRQYEPRLATVSGYPATTRRMAAQTQMVAFMRSLFKQHVLTNSMVRSVAIADAALTNQTLYEVDRSQFTRATYDRAIESMEAVNAEIVELKHTRHGGVNHGAQERSFQSDVARRREKLTPVNPVQDELRQHVTYKGIGALGAVTRSIDALAAKADAAKEIEAKLAAGEIVIELGGWTRSRNPSFPTSLAHSDEQFQELVEAMRVRGQDSPILVRPQSGKIRRLSDRLRPSPCARRAPARPPRSRRRQGADRPGSRHRAGPGKQRARRSLLPRAGDLCRRTGNARFRSRDDHVGAERRQDDRLKNAFGGEPHTQERAQRDWPPR